MSGRIQRVAFTRMLVSRLFDSSCEIRRSEEPLVGPLDGGLFACSVIPLYQGGRIEGDFSNINGWQVKLPVGTDVRIDDYIIEKERTLQVIEVPSPKSLEIYMIAVCQRV